MDTGADGRVRGSYNQRKSKNKDPYERCETGRFRPSGHKRGDRCRCTFVNVRSPHMERCGSDLKAKANEHHGHADEKQSGILRSIHTAGNPGNICPTRCAIGSVRDISESDAVEKKCGRERSENKV